MVALKNVILLLVAISCVYGQDRDEELKLILKPIRIMFLEQKPAQKILEDLSDRMVREFDGFLEQPEHYRQQAMSECAVFPEGRIYPFAMPALAYANLAIRYPHRKSHYLKQTATLIDLLIPIVSGVSPSGDLLQLTDYGGHGTYLSTVNLVLGAYALSGGDRRYDKIHTRVSEVLYKAVKDGDGTAIHSYPTYTWNFDTITALLSLHLYDRVKGMDQTQALLQKHLQWRSERATHEPTGLPYSIWEEGTGVRELPRGCDLSMQICLLAQMDKDAARALYRKYVASHWVDHGFAAGFSEWPKDKIQSWGDIDSGPIFFGIGLTATGIGIGATLAVGDRERLQTLCSQLTIVEPIIKVMASLSADNKLLDWYRGRLTIDSRYFTGFLYGDAVLFYAITWAPYPVTPP